MAESAGKTTKSIMKKCKKAGTDPLLAVLDYRNTPTESMGTSPAQRMFSRRTKTLLPTKKELLKPTIVETTVERKALTKEKQAYYYDKTAKDLPKLSQGTVVRIQPLGNRKLPWKKGIVKRQVCERSYEIVTRDGGPKV